MKKSRIDDFFTFLFMAVVPLLVFIKFTNVSLLDEDFESDILSQFNSMVLEKEYQKSALLASREMYSLINDVINQSYNRVLIKKITIIPKGKNVIIKIEERLDEEEKEKLKEYEEELVKFVSDSKSDKEISERLKKYFSDWEYDFDEDFSMKKALDLKRGSCTHFSYLTYKTLRSLKKDVRYKVGKIEGYDILHAWVEWYSNGDLRLMDLTNWIQLRDDRFIYKTFKEAGLKY